MCTRDRVAKYATLTPDMIQAEVEYELAREYPFGVAELVALDTCPPDLLVNFASPEYMASVRDDGYSNRLNVAYAAQKHSRLPISFIEKNLLESPDTGSVMNLWCISMLQNLNVPAHVFEKLLARRSALGLRDDFIFMIIGHTNCPAEVIESESVHENRSHRAQVALRPTLPLKVIERLLHDSDIGIQRIMIENINIDPFNFEILLDTPRNRISKISPSALQALVRRFPNDERRQRAVDMLAIRSHGRSSREVIARYSADPEVALAGCLDPTIEVRRQAIRNPVVPEEGLIAAALLGKSRLKVRR